MITDLAIGIMGYWDSNDWSGHFLKRLSLGAGSVEFAAIIWVVLLLGSIGAAAALLPARRAIQIDPMIAQRCE